MPTPNETLIIKEIHDRLARWYDWLKLPLELLFLRRKRRAIITPLAGNVLEVGIGTGANLPYYRKDVRLTATDISPEMLKIIARRARRIRLAADFREMDSEHLQFPDGSFDAAVSTLTLCTVADPVKAIREMRRVCKPGGKLSFLEHGKSDRPWLARFQARREPKQFEKHRCHLTREPLAIIRSAGLNVVATKKFFFGVFQQIEART